MRLPIQTAPLLLVSALAIHASAQMHSDTRQTDVTQLERYVVAEVPVERSINPLTREVASVLGDGRNVLNTPRGVSTLTTALFNERQIHGVREVLLYSPGANAGASYGKTTVPNLRGDTAETYLNGQRLSYNLYGYFPSFNGVEAIDLVRGPGSAVFGAGYFTGGYVNYVTKQPSFSAAATTVTARIGTWAPDEISFLNGSVQIDSTAPLSSRLAWRVSYEGKTGDTFWRRHDVPDDRQDFFAAFAWRPAAGTRVDVSAQWLWQSSPEILGVNRVTQELIDHGTYYTGASADLTPFPGPVPATGTVALPWDATLFSKGDYSNANVGRLQASVTREMSSDLKLVNRSLYEFVERRRAHAFEYAEWVTQHTAENRTELHVRFPLFGLSQAMIAGGTVRYEGRESYTNYFNEYFYNFDITNPSGVFSQRDQYSNSYWPGQPGPDGREFFSNAFGCPETVRSETWNPALFWQHEVALTRQLSLLAGVRGERFFARVRDPLPPQGGPFFRDAETVSNHSQNYSVVYRISPSLSLYATHNRIHAATGNVTGGGVILNLPDGQINRADFRNLSELLEAGAKTALLENRLFLGAAIFEQSRSRVSLGGSKSNILLHGAEIETTFQPSRHLSVTANATFQSGHYVDSAPFQMGGRSIYNLFAKGRGPSGLGRAGGDFNPYDNQVPAGDWPLLGLPGTMLNGSLRYQWPSGLGASVTAQWQNRQAGNLDREWHIPPQVMFNASVFLEKGRWLLNVDFLNVTNERNWGHNGDAYTSSQLIFPELPFRMEAFIKYRF